MKKTVILTIGQAPRADIESTYERYFAGEKAVIQAGLLDGLTKKEAETLYGVDMQSQEKLVSRLTNGQSVTMDKQKVKQGLQKKIEAFELQGYEWIVIFCTGNFSDLHAVHANLVEPEKVIPGQVAKLSGAGRLGIVVPLKSQALTEDAKWSVIEDKVYTAASPYQGTKKDFLRAGKWLKEQGAKLAVLDCVGYSDSIRQVIEQAFEGPVIQSNEVVFEYVKERARE